MRYHLPLILVLGLLGTGSPTSGFAAETNDKADFSKVPGVVITHIPAASGTYIGSPSIAVLPNGHYVASHDLFGPKSTEHSSAVSRVFQSTDRGRTWTRISEIDGAFWSTLFVHQGNLYLLGTSRHHGDVVLRRSTDGGTTWTVPKDKDSGLLRQGQYHCAPVPVLVHRGRLWRAVEDASNGKEWGKRYSAMMLSVPVDADLLKAENWTASTALKRDPQWLDGTFHAWLEGNAVATPEGKIVDILRVDAKRNDEKAAIVGISDDGRTASFDARTGFVDFPGGSKKFTIRFDPTSQRYWSLSNSIPSKPEGVPTAAMRNTLSLISSSNLKDWTVQCVVLQHPDRTKHAFQYVDWLFEGDDLLVVSRTAYDDGLGGAHSSHDANFMTFHRIEHFRDLTTKDSVVAPLP